MNAFVVDRNGPGKTAPLLAAIHGCAKKKLRNISQFFLYDDDELSSNKSFRMHRVLDSYYWISRIKWMLWIS